jgi:2-dehydro-3-deoxygluconokinase
MEARACQEPFMQYVDTLITTEEDTRVVFGIEAPKGSDENFTNIDAVGYRVVAEQLAERFKLHGVAITLRQNKSVWFNDWWGLYYDADAKTFYQAPKIPVEIVDRVGAGDSFAGGLLAALMINPGDYDYAIRFAVAASAIKHSIPGDFNVITRAEVETLMKGGGLRIVR